MGLGLLVPCKGNFTVTTYNVILDSNAVPILWQQGNAPMLKRAARFQNLMESFPRRVEDVLAAY